MINLKYLKTTFRIEIYRAGTQLLVQKMIKSHGTELFRTEFFWFLTNPFENIAFFVD